MNIDELTIGQARELVSIFADSGKGFYANYIGKYVIVRSRNEGVNAGYVVDADSTGVVLKDARRMWRHRPLNKSDQVMWYESCANHGLSTDGYSRLSEPVTEKAIVENYSITVCSENAAISIQSYKNE